MSEKIICTVDELKKYLKAHLSEKRFNHCLGVAQTTAGILRHYNCPDYGKYLDFEAPVFCGLMHDVARELSDAEIIDYCSENGILLDEDEQKFPVLAHGKVSSSIGRALGGNYPDSWENAICEHTTGNRNMQDISLALFCADYLEPSRTYLTDEKRKEYLCASTLKECAYMILCDMMKHWKEKGNHISCSKSMDMKAWLEEKN